MGRQYSDRNPLTGATNARGYEKNDDFYLAIQRSVWRDIKFAFVCLFVCLFVCTVEDISTQDGAIGVKFWLRVEQTPETGTR